MINIGGKTVWIAKRIQGQQVDPIKANHNRDSPFSGGQGNQTESDTGNNLGIPCSQVSVNVTKVSEGTEDGDVEDTQGATSDFGPQDDFLGVQVDFGTFSLGSSNLGFSFRSGSELFGNDTEGEREIEDEGQETTLGKVHSSSWRNLLQLLTLQYQTNPRYRQR
ncbi:MAG: hypothetical protein ACRYGR_01050 [Janthinobacterium lividum]